MHQSDFNKQFIVRALKVVETIVEAPDLAAAGIQARYECERDKVKLLEVEAVHGQGNAPVVAGTIG